MVNLRQEKAYSGSRLTPEQFVQMWKDPKTKNVKQVADAVGKSQIWCCNRAARLRYLGIPLRLFNEPKVEPTIDPMVKAWTNLNIKALKALNAGTPNGTVTREATKEVAAPDQKTEQPVEHLYTGRFQHMKPGQATVCVKDHPLDLSRKHNYWDSKENVAYCHKHLIRFYRRERKRILRAAGLNNSV